MHDFLSDHYLWVKTLHVFAMIAWMAGLFYLPRLFVYHADAVAGSELSETFKIMERRLYRIIMTPAMLATWGFALLLMMGNPAVMGQGWLHAKLLLVVLMTGFHGFLGRWRHHFVADANRHSGKFYRKINEVPTILLLAILALAIAKPF